MLDLQVLDCDVVAGVQDRVIELLVTFHDRPLAVDDDAAQDQVVLVDVDRLGVGARVDLDNVAGLGSSNGGLNRVAITYLMNGTGPGTTDGLCECMAASRCSAVARRVTDDCAAVIARELYAGKHARDEQQKCRNYQGQSLNHD